VGALELERKKRFGTRDLALMTLFAAIGGSFSLTTRPISAMIPIPLLGFGGIVYIPVSTLFLLIAVGLVRSIWSATFTSTIMGIVAFLLGGGPGILVLPTSILNGILVDILLWVTRRNVDDSPLVAAFTAFTPTLVTTWFMWWGFGVVFGKIIPLFVFVAIFIGLHGILMIIGGLASYYVLKRIRRLNLD
jgi:hypothetical protein